MNLGQALIVCTILVLAVFRPEFRKSLLWTVVIGAALGIVAGGVWWGWSAYQRHAERAASAKHRADVDACVKRLTSIDPNSTPKTLPANWFDAVDACEKNPAAAPQIDFSKYEEPPKVSKSSIVEIHGGETLKIVQAKDVENLPKDAVPIPILYLGHKQEFLFVCGVFGEQGHYPTIKDSTARCP